MMQNGRINSPSLDFACPQVEADKDKYVHMFRDRGVDNIKYGHEGIMVILIQQYIYIYILSYDLPC